MKSDNNGQKITRLNPTAPSPSIKSTDGFEIDRREKYYELNKNELVRQFNAQNAKIIAFSIICGFIFYHTILRLTHGIDSCKWLLSDGNFRDQVWQPYGCMMHHYSHVDARRCLRYMEYWGGKNNFVFIGDSRVEQMYHSFIHQISPEYQGPPVTKSYKNNWLIDDEFIVNYENLAKKDISHNNSQLGLRVQFLWYPYTNKSMIMALQKLKIKNDYPSVVVIGSGGWSIRSSDPLDPNALEDYIASLTHLVLHIDNLAEVGTRVLWALQEPVDPEKLSDEWVPVTNERIDTYNIQSKKILRYSKADLWSSGRSVAIENLVETLDGYHLGPKTLFQDSQILLNMYCNDNMNYNDATCCSSSEKISKLQIITFSFLLVSSILGFILFIKRKLELNYSKERGVKGFSYSHLKNSLPSILPLKNNKGESVNLESNLYDIFTSLGKLAIILAFFFICDRTTMFMKENKFFTQTNFWLPVVYILILGLFFTEDSGFTKVVHYDQDSESKGWMVLLILVYNMMGASQVLPIYMFVKTLYTSLLFLHGWSQFLNYLQRGDYSIVKFFQDLFRLNAMAVLLCVCMNRPYQFYEFIPLISFWTLITYVALSLPPRITWASCDSNPLHYLYLVLKILGIISFVTILYMSQVFFEKVFVTRPWKALFVSSDDEIREWWMRWKVDRYSMPLGMIVAFGSHLGRKYKIVKDDNHGNLFSMRLSLTAILFSILGIVGYTLFSFSCRNQLECLEIHAYIAFIPITSYLILRNVSGILRTRFSSFFAWFGQFWVELLVGQFHVWMGADGHGVLVLVPAYPVGNVLLTAFVFICTAHEIHNCTEKLTQYAVPEDWWKTLRNAFIFLLVLIPIGVSDGMF